MSKRGLSRPGATQIVAALVLTGLTSVGALAIAATRPNQEFLMILTGFPALAMALSGLLVAVLYIVGFLRYCSNKGYSKWLGLSLLLSTLPGFLALLLLPDLKEIEREARKKFGKIPDVVTIGGD